MFTGQDTIIPRPPHAYNLVCKFMHDLFTLAYLNLKGEALWGPS